MRVLGLHMCKGAVHYGSWGRTRPCYNCVKYGERFCHAHDPATVEKRRLEKFERQTAKSRKFLMPYLKVKALQRRVAKLERLVKRLGGKVPA